MRDNCNFSNVTKDYLSKFYCILDEMIQGMTSPELSCSISHNFILQMIPHHRAAIEMSHNILCYTTDIAIQNIALNIIEMQTQSIENMCDIEYTCSMCTNSQQDFCLYQRQFSTITQTMFSEMGNACSTNNINANFMREMIPHHKGAIRMSENALRFNICPELKPILSAIITSQQKGVCEMTQLLRCIK